MSIIDSQGQQPPAGTGDQSQQQQQGQGSDSLAENFLSAIPEEHKEIVGKYVKEWDAGVTRKFQEIHGTYAPYKELGDIDSLNQAITIAKMLDEDPEHIYNALAEMLGKNVQSTPQGGGGSVGSQIIPNGSQQQVPPELNAFLTPVQEQMAQQQKMLEQMAQILVQSNNQSRDAQEDAALENYLAELKTRHGEFDEESVLLKIMNGTDADQAVEQWKAGVLEAAKTLGYTTYQGPNPPPALSGGSIPDNGTSVVDMDRKQTRSLVADIMNLANQQGH